MIHPTAKRLAALLGVAMVLTLGIAYVVVHGSIKAAQGMCDANSLRTFASQEDDPNTKTYLEQEAQACEGTTVTASGSDGSAASSSSSTAPITSTVKSPTTIPPTPSRTTIASSRSPQTSEVNGNELRFYATESNKAAPNNFGPKVAMDPSLHGMPMQSMNTNQAKQELKYRYHRDPMLTASTGCAFKLWKCSPSTLQAKTQLFMQDPIVWEEAKTAIDRKVDGMASAVKTLPAGNYVSTYALSGDAYPQVFSDSIYRDSDMEALVFADGTTLRLICGFQVYWAPVTHKSAPPVKAAPKKVVPIAPAPAPAERPKPLPKPSHGMTRTPEGVPEKLVSVCVPQTGKVIQVPAHKVNKYPATGKCAPTTPTPSTTTSTTPPATSTTPPVPPSTTSTPPPATTPPPSTTPPPATSTTLPPKCPEGTTDPACHSLPPGSAGKPTDNAPTLEPSPTHTGPTYNPTSEPSKPAESSSSTPSPTTSRTVPSNEAPKPSETATGGPSSDCAVCG